MGFLDWDAMVDRGRRVGAGMWRQCDGPGARGVGWRGRGRGRRRECGRRIHAVRMDAARNQLLIAGAYQEIEVDGPLPAAWIARDQSGRRRCLGDAG